MPFEKGNTHGQGRPKGASNKETKRIREWISTFLDGNKEQMQEDILGMNPKDRVGAMLQLMEYSVPKLARTELVSEGDNQFTIRVITHSEANADG